jgi:hypothetical protein
MAAAVPSITRSDVAFCARGSNGKGNAAAVVVRERPRNAASGWRWSLQVNIERDGWARGVFPCLIDVGRWHFGRRAGGINVNGIGVVVHTVTTMTLA